MMRAAKIVWMFYFVTALLHAAPLQQAQPWLGVAIDEKGKSGVLIKSVLPQTPAEKAGLQAGDSITAIDSSAVQSRDELMAVLRSKGVGHTVTVHFTRQGKLDRKTLKLEALPDRLEMMNKQVLDKPLPPFKVTRIADGQTLTNSWLMGKVTVVEFWATWCPACRAAIPRINQWAPAHPNVQFIGITDEKEDLVKEFLKRETMKYTVAIDASQDLQTALQVGSIPTFLLVDSKGVVRAIAMGAGDYLEELLKKAEALSKSP